MGDSHLRNTHSCKIRVAGMQQELRLTERFIQITEFEWTERIFHSLPAHRQPIHAEVKRDVHPQYLNQVYGEVEVEADFGNSLFHLLISRQYLLILHKCAPQPKVLASILHHLARAGITLHL